VVKNILEGICFRGFARLGLFKLRAFPLEVFQMDETDGAILEGLGLVSASGLLHYLRSLTSSMESACPTNRLVEGRAFSVSLMRASFFRWYSWFIHSS
jgi:hypothetical protein